MKNKAVKFSLLEAKQIFQDAALKADKKGIVYFSPHAVENAIRKTSSCFTRYPLDSSYEKIDMGDHKLYSMPSSTLIYLLNLETRK